MLVDRHPDDPRPGDIVQLRTGNSIGAGPDQEFVVVEGFPPCRVHLVLNLPDSYPEHEDWAAAVTAQDIRRATRLELGGPRTWAPADNPRPAP
ncbi:DUF6211 family protein [Streptomyces sp. NPDC051561]|uniref:DUF6211 family protein n=1 Tax=Streptomyces sp. NPDC051561 TaxID=3365658 RepID=UPI0037B147D8